MVVMDYPDPPNNRVILEVTAAPDAFLYRLATQFDPSAIAILVLDHRPAISPQGRGADNSPLFGGAVIKTPLGCTDGFSWHDGSQPMMLTAGHCAPNGSAHVMTPAVEFGTIHNTTEETWNTGVGSTLLGGSYRGDIALIRIDAGLTSAGYMFRGGPGSSTSAPVKQMWSRRSQAADQYCTGGAVSGEIRGWQVYSAGGNLTYDSGEVARHVVVGSKYGWCVRPGDSGGPEYTVRSDGGIAAKGIHSGGGGGGSDFYAGAFDDPCFDVFTDIWDAYTGFPGLLTIT